MIYLALEYRTSCRSLTVHHFLRATCAHMNERSRLLKVASVPAREFMHYSSEHGSIDNRRNMHVCVHGLECVTVHMRGQGLEWGAHRLAGSVHRTDDA